MSSLNTGPLSGIKILEIEAIGPVPFCGMMLADLGAEIIRIDRPVTTGLGVLLDSKVDTGSRGRRSIALDMKSASGVAIVKTLMADSDVVIEGMRPGAMERLGLGPDEAMAANLKLVYARMTGWGQEGERSHQAGHDINYISLNGTLGSFGQRDGPPTIPLNMMGDYGGGALFLVIGILAAVLECKNSGKGQVIDAAMIDGSNYLMSVIHMLMKGGLWQDGKRGSNALDGGMPFYSVYETKDGKYMSVGCLEPKFYRDFIEGLGVEVDDLSPQNDPAGWDQMRVVFTERIKSKTQAEWTAIFEGTDACVTPVLTMQESHDNITNKARDLYGFSGEIEVPAPAPRFSRTPASVAGGPVSSGTHTTEILTDIGFTDAEISALIKEGTIAQK